MKDILRLFIYVLSFLYALNCSAQELRLAVEHEGDLFKGFEYELKLMTVDDLSSPNLFNNLSIDGGLQLKLSKKISIGAGYRYSADLSQSEERTTDEFESKRRINFDCKYKNKSWIDNVKFSNRLRYQLKFKDGKSKFYLKNKVKFDYKFSKKTKPYLAFEPNFDLQKKEFKVLRVYGGSVFKIIKNKVDVYLIYELNKKAKLSSAYILGLSYLI